jgi:TorA maturation chaperone TorD
MDCQASAEDRSRFFWWLAQWYLQPPSRENLAGLTSESAVEPPLDAMDEAWLALAHAAANQESTPPEALGAEFTRLFTGVNEGTAPPPPFESVWREDRLIGESTVQVIDAYAKAGFADIEPDAGPQDHIAVELKFIALLALREAEAWQADDPAAAQRRQAQQREFLDQHLATWAPRWANAVIEQTREPLYAALAGMLKACVEQAALELKNPVRLAA